MELGTYIEDYSQTKIPSPYGPLDGNGVPLFDLRFVRSKLAESGGRMVYHPIAIIQYGLAHHTLWKRGNPGAEEEFLACARWLQENAAWEPRERFMVWYYPYSLAMPQVSTPWFSGMAQGQALSLLMRAYELTGSATTMEVARRAADSFLYEVREGGTLSKTTSGNYFVEEYPSIPAVHILNGCLFGLVGLFESLTVFPSEGLEAILESCVRGVEEVLPNYDLGWWSRYSLGLRWNMASFHYHHVHVVLLSYLGELLDSDLFCRFARRWRSYERMPRIRLRRKILGLLSRAWNRVLHGMALSDLRYRGETAFRQ